LRLWICWQFANYKLPNYQFFKGSAFIGVNQRPKAFAADLRRFRGSAERKKPEVRIEVLDLLAICKLQITQLPIL
jgi:hypothetical protein